MKKNSLFILTALFSALVSTACGGSEEVSEDTCSSMNVEDFNDFLGLKENTPETEFKKILPGVASGYYSDDKTVFTYVYEDVENIITYVNVHAESGKIAYYNILLDSYDDQSLEKTQKTMRKEYKIDDCHDQFFMMSQKEIEKIMGKDNEVNETGQGDYWLIYRNDDGMSVHFYFPITQELGCIMIRVAYNWYL